MIKNEEREENKPIKIDYKDKKHNAKKESFIEISNLLRLKIGLKNDRLIGLGKDKISKHKASNRRDFRNIRIDNANKLLKLQKLRNRKFEKATFSSKGYKNSIKFDLYQINKQAISIHKTRKRLLPGINSNKNKNKNSLKLDSNHNKNKTISLTNSNRNKNLKTQTSIINELNLRDFRNIKHHKDSIENSSNEKSNDSARNKILIQESNSNNEISKFNRFNNKKHKTTKFTEGSLTKVSVFSTKLEDTTTKNYSTFKTDKNIPNIKSRANLPNHTFQHISNPNSFKYVKSTIPSIDQSILSLKSKFNLKSLRGKDIKDLYGLEEILKTQNEIDHWIKKI